MYLLQLETTSDEHKRGDVGDTFPGQMQFT